MTWDDLAPEWDDNPSVQGYAEAVDDSLRTIISDRGLALGELRVCDFGCGTGLLTERLVGSCHSVLAVDTSAPMRAELERKVVARGWKNVRIAATVPAGERFDLVACSSVLAFVDDYKGTVGALVDRLEPGGLFVQWDWELLPDDAESHGLSRERIEATLAGAGLAAVEVATAFEVTVDGATMAPLVGIGEVEAVGHS